MRDNEHEVVVAGGGPTGMVLAAELALAGVDVAVVERRADRALDGSRAGGLQARTLEVFDQRGIAERFISEGQQAQVHSFGGRLDISDFPTRHPYGLGLWQSHIERILGEWVAELDVVWRRGVEVTGLAQDATGVDVELSGGSTLRARYLVGCDGGRSTVRKAAGIDFPGWDPTTSSLIAEGQMDEPEIGIRHDELGTHGIGRHEYEIVDGEIVYADEGPVRVMITEPAPSTGDPTEAEIRAGIEAVYGTDFGLHDVTFLSRFSDMSRQAEAYRRGRVLLAGDAAHIHAPDGGQGLNTGVQDATNLGWKLAQVVAGTSPEALLDSYHSERHPIGARVLRNTMALSALRRPDPRTVALGEAVGELVAMEEPRRRFGAMMSGLDINYDLGEGHPLLGRRMPDLDVETADGPGRVYELLHEATPLLLDFTGEIAAPPARVRLVTATTTGPWELPALGEVPAPTSVLVRPDGYVCWVGEGTDEGLEDALVSWFGAGAG